MEQGIELHISEVLKKNERKKENRKRNLQSIVVFQNQQYLNGTRNIPPKHLPVSPNSGFL